MLHPRQPGISDRDAHIRATSQPALYFAAGLPVIVAGLGRERLGRHQLGEGGLHILLLLLGILILSRRPISSSLTYLSLMSASKTIATSSG